MTAKRMQNTHEKNKQLDWVKKSKLFQAFYKQYTAYEFNTVIEISKKLQKPKPNKYTEKHFHKIHSKINQY